MYWKCDVCECMLLSSVGYVNHLKGPHSIQKQANLPHRPANNTSVVCIKDCNLSSELRRHMVVYRRVVGHADPINPVKDRESICHTCMIPMNSNAGLKSQFSLNGYRHESETIASDVKGGEAVFMQDVAVTLHVCKRKAISTLFIFEDGPSNGIARNRVEAIKYVYMYVYMHIYVCMYVAFVSHEKSYIGRQITSELCQKTCRNRHMKTHEQPERNFKNRPGLLQNNLVCRVGNKHSNSWFH